MKRTDHEIGYADADALFRLGLSVRFVVRLQIAVRISPIADMLLVPENTEYRRGFNRRVREETDDERDADVG